MGHIYALREIERGVKQMSKTSKIYEFGKVLARFSYSKMFYACGSVMNVLTNLKNYLILTFQFIL